MSNELKSAWEKADVILKPLGGFLTALAVALVGILGSQFLDRKQAIDTNVRLYADLMSRREEADTSLRKEMFKSIVDTFLKPSTGRHEEKVLSLELLAYNFHESLDLAPLFKTLHQEIIDSPTPLRAEYVKRLEKVAKEVTSKQVEALEEGGQAINASVDFDLLDQNPAGIRVINHSLRLHSENTGNGGPDRLPGCPKADLLAAGLKKNEWRCFRVEVMGKDTTRKELRIHLQISTPGEKDIDVLFPLSYFEFPMIDNTRLSHAQRCAIVLRDFQPVGAQITLVYFPGSRASLKDKQYFDEVMHDLLTAPTYTEEHKKQLP